MRWYQYVILIALLLALASLAACATMPTSPSPASQATPIPGEIGVSNARARSAPMAGGNGAAFLTVLNGMDQTVQLVSAASPVAEVVELHETVDENGVMRMIPHPEGFPIEAGGSLELAPGGKHVMFIGLVAPLVAGESISLTLTFSPAETIELTVPVVEVGAMSGMSGMGSEGGTAGSDAMHEGPMGMPLPALVETLPIDAIHDMSESLEQGNLVPDAGEAVAALLQALEDRTWPQGVQSTIDEIRTTAEALQTTLIAGDIAAATPLAVELHGLLHSLEMTPVE